MGFGFMISMVMTLLAIVSVFIFLPLFSEYAFWIVIAASIILEGTALATMLPAWVRRA